MGIGVLLLVYFVGCVIFGIALLVRRFGWQGILNRLGLNRKKIVPISGTFAARTLPGFKVEYAITLSCKRLDKEEFKRARLDDNEGQAALVDAYNKDVFRRLLREDRYFFSLESQCSSKNGRPFGATFCATLHGINEDMTIWTSNPPFLALEFGTTRQASWTKGGCEVTYKGFELKPPCPEIVKENYAMLSDAQKEQILNDPRFTALQEAIAVAALKLRLDLIDHHEQRHETDEIVIETMKAGRGLKITWRFKTDAARKHELLGFRTTGGFFHDKWSESHNGTLVVHSQIDGNAVEFLKEGEPAYYTFFLREKKPRRKNEPERCSSIRFQITIAAKDELEEIQKVLDGATEEKAPDPRMTEIINDLGLVMEFHDAMDAMERSLIEKVKGKKLSKDEREEKLAFVRDAVRLQREKYQP